MQPIKCLFCNKEFTPYRRTTRLCSDECRYQRKLVTNLEGQRKLKRSVRPFELPERPCKHCGKMFQPRSVQNFYCRPECREVHQQAAQIRFKQYLDSTYGE